MKKLTSIFLLIGLLGAHAYAASNIDEATITFVGRATRHEFSDLGSDLVTNGTFAADSDWTKGDGWSIAAGVASSDGTQAGVSYLQSTGLVLTEGTTYLFKSETTANSAGNGWQYINGGLIAVINSVGTYVSYNTALGANTIVGIRADTNFVGSVDNVEVYTWVGSTNSAGGITVAGALAASSGGVFDPAAIMNADGSPLVETTGAITDSGGSVLITDASAFGAVVVGTLFNLDSDGTHTDGVYEITAVTANTITLDLTYVGDEAAITAGYVGGAFPNVQTAYDDDSTDVVDGAGAYHHRYIATNTDEYTAVTITPAGGDRASSKYEHTVAFGNYLHIPNENAADDRIISDMDAESYAGTYASNFTTSYYMGAIECARAVESKVRKRSAGDQVQWDADDNAIDVVTIGGDNVEIRNVYMHNTDRSAGADVLYAAAAKEGTTLINCRLDDSDDLIDGANLDESVLIDVYFGANIVQNQSLSGMSSTLFQTCFFNGNGLLYLAASLDDSSAVNCIFYKSTRGILLAAGTSGVMNSVFFDQTESCFYSAATRNVVLYNNIFSPAAAADYACYAGDDGTFIGSNNIAYSVTAGALLTTPFFNNGESAAFWLPNTVEQDPQFVDAENLDFRSKAGLFKGVRGFDPDVSSTNIGLSQNAGVTIIP